MYLLLEDIFDEVYEEGLNSDTISETVNEIKNADMIITYSSYCKNELELIYSFLNIIFSTLLLTKS